MRSTWVRVRARSIGFGLGLGLGLWVMVRVRARARRFGRLAQHHETRVELGRVEHLVGRIEGVGQLALGPASVGPAGEVEGGDAARRVLPQAVERA